MPAPDKKKKIRVLIVDDHAIVRQGLRRLIEEERDLVVSGEAEDGPGALELLSAAKPDVALVDIGLQGMSGIDLIKNLKARLPKLPILAISMYDESVYAERVLRAGAKGYIMKKESAEKVVAGIRRVLSGKLFLSDAIAEKILNKIAESPSEGGGSPVDALSDRELEVFQLIGKGYKTSRIAEELNLSVKTVESYREQIKNKLDLEHASDLAQYAVEWSRTKNPT